LETFFLSKVPIDGANNFPEHGDLEGKGCDITLSSKKHTSNKSMEIVSTKAFKSMLGQARSSLATLHHFAS
jgi:hypothetical protein